MNTMHDPHHLAAAYALDALTADERREFEAHYPTCGICAAEVRDFRETAAELAHAAGAAPPLDVKARVMAEIATTPQLSPVLPDGVIDLSERRRLRATRPMLLAAAAAAIVGIVATVGSLSLRTGGTTIDDVIAAPDAVTTVLEGESGAMTVVWSPDSDRLAVVGNDLADPGPGMTYELWFILDEGVAPAGLFTPEQGVVGRVFEVEDLSAQGWGVTIEPDGGSQQPTGDILYSGLI